MNKLNTANNRYDELTADLNGNRVLTKIKSAIVKVKKEIKEASLNEGIMKNMLFSCMQMRNGKHHLYDDELLAIGSDSPGGKK